MRTRMNDTGTDWSQLKANLEQFKASDVNWSDGRLGVYVFHAGHDVLAVGKDAYNLYQTENALGINTAFPSLKRMESEVLDMGLDLLNAPDGACGNMTSGGSESIFMAVMACRNQAAANGMDVGKAELVIPFSAHPAFDKAAGYLGLTVKRVPVLANHLADVAQMASAVTDNTIMLVGSAPCYPYGLVDPIADLSDLALDKSLWLHVDACVGGYYLPHARRCGIDVPTFDFSLPGVASMSADLHKYGYTPKAASTVFHRSQEQREHQIFTFDNWPAGSMTTPTAAGSRPGGAIAGAWAVMNYLGRSGYEEKARQIIAAQTQLATAVKTMQHLHILHDVRNAITVITADQINIFHVWKGMVERGWFVSAITAPPGLQLMVQPYHTEVMADFLKDLEEVSEVVASAKSNNAEIKPQYS